MVGQNQQPKQCFKEEWKWNAHLNHHNKEWKFPFLMEEQDLLQTQCLIVRGGHTERRKNYETKRTRHILGTKKTNKENYTRERQKTEMFNFT